MAVVSLRRSLTRNSGRSGSLLTIWSRSKPPVMPRKCISWSTGLPGSYLWKYASSWARSPLLKASSQALKVRPAGVSGIAGGAWGVACVANAAAKAKSKAKHDLENNNLENMGAPQRELELVSLNSDPDCHD